MRPAGLLFFILIVLLATASRPRHTAVSLAKTVTAESIESMDCGGSGSRAADVTFAWRPNADAMEQWLEVSVFDDGFVPGTYYTANVGITSSFTWKGLLSNVAWFWRIKTWNGDGWASTRTSPIVPAST